ncbi:MAG: MBL fold metallo-hydrolase [Syntrophales bacterium]
MKETRFGRLVFIPGERGGRYPFCNSLFIDDDCKTIIDPASDEAALRDLSLKKGIDTIINTHYHEDHTAFNHLFPGAELVVHEALAPCYKSYSAFLDYCGLLDSRHRKEWDHLFLQKFHFQERTPAVELRDGDTITFGRTRAEVLHTPGHTTGHCSFYFPDEGVLFLGDYDLGPFGPWYGDRVSDIDQTIESVRRLRNIPAGTYITSHDMGIIQGSIADLAETYLEVIDRREKDLLAFLEKPRSLDEIVNRWIIYKKEMQPRYFFEFAEEGMIKKHLERLIRNGRAETKEGRYRKV